MRKTALIVFMVDVLVVISSHSKSQNPVPNPGFEDWIAYPQWEDPESWGTPNPTTYIFGFSTVTKDSSSFSGALAARMATKSQGTLSIPGVLCTGTLSSLDNSCKGGFPVAEPYGYLSGYYKYAPGTGDSAFFYSILWNWNNGTQSRDTVALINVAMPGASAYTFFEFPFEYTSLSNPDSGMIIISTTQSFLSAPEGSILLVDDMALSGVVGIPEQKFMTMNLSPNPADDLLHFYVPFHDVLYESVVINVLGQIVGSEKSSNREASVKTGHLPDGCYRILVRGTTESFRASASFIVKH